MINDKWSTNRQYSFLTESFAKKKQTNEHKQNQQSKPARKKQTNNTYQFHIPRHQKFLRNNENEWNTKLSEQKTYIHTEQNSNAKDETYFPSFAIVKD